MGSSERIQGGNQFNPAVLSRGFDVAKYNGAHVFVKGIAHDPGSIANYCKGLSLKTSAGLPVIAPLREVIIPQKRFDTTIIGYTRPKNDSELSPIAVSELRQAETNGLLKIRELASELDYSSAAQALGMNEGSFYNTMVQINTLIFVSEWVGPNLYDYLGAGKSSETQRKIGQRLGEALKTLHQADLIAGDTHLGQFVVQGDADAVMRIDLGKVDSRAQLGSQLNGNKEAEYHGLLTELGRYETAAEAFVLSYAA